MKDLRRKHERELVNKKSDIIDKVNDFIQDQ